MWGSEKQWKKVIVLKPFLWIRAARLNNQIRTDVDRACHLKLRLVLGFAHVSLYAEQLTGDAPFISKQLTTWHLHYRCSCHYTVSPHIEQLCSGNGRNCKIHIHYITLCFNVYRMFCAKLYYNLQHFTKFGANISSSSCRWSMPLQTVLRNLI